MNLAERDKKIIWHPFTQEKNAKMPMAIKYAKGSYVYDENDSKYLDLISSWWVNLHGHANSEIAQSIYEQALKLEHIIFAGFTHEPAVKLCENLSSILPQSLRRFFFSDNGSTAVEIALKMAYQFWQNQGKDRKIFLSFDGGYHGDTFGAMSVGQKSGFHSAFKDLFFEVLTVPFPDTWYEDLEVEAKEQNALHVLEKYLDEQGQNIAAIILEPLVQGASGMRMCRPQFINKVVEKVREFEVLVIFDEVMTGFGRIGTNFALDQLNVTPDFLCLSKGITGGFLPLALTVMTERIYNAFLSDEWKHALAHGHSYTANPLACAAAVKSLEILQRVETQKAIKNMNQAHISGVQFLKENSGNVKNFRMLGTICSFDTKSPVNNELLKEQFLKRGLLIRPLGRSIYLLPPYSTEVVDIAASYYAISSILNETLT